MSILYAWSARTDVGAVRGHNEDCFVVEPKIGLFVVCDGMGGHAHGDVASSTACATIRDWIAAQPPSPRPRVAEELLVEAIREANRCVHRLGTGERRPGTTVAAMLWAGGASVIAHVGDSRVFRLRQGKLIQLTRDHSFVNQLLHRNVITRAVGLRQEVEVDVQAARVLPGDVFLLASDGLEVVDAAAVRACLELPPAAAADRLIACSLARGAPDNVTVAVVRAEGRS